MRNSSKTATLESRLPLLAVEQNCIISKDGDVTACFAVSLPELFTAGSADYEAIHSAWHKAVKTLPDFTVVHKQDWYVKENYNPNMEGEEQSFLARTFERHFNERPFLNHCCYLFLTKTTRERMRMQSNFSSLCRGTLIPKEVRDPEAIRRFMETVAQFERILNDSGLIRLNRLTEEDLTGADHRQGILEQYLTLSKEEGASLEDIALGAEQVRVGSKRLSLHTLSDTDDLPAAVASDTRYEKLSTDRSDCRLSFAAPVGLLLGCNHIYNQYLFLDSSEENLQKFEKSARNMHSLARYSRANQINREWIEKYLNEAHSLGLSSIRAHFNIMAWSDDPAELKQLKNDCGSALALMECKPRHNTADAATLYWAGMPGNAGDFPCEESFYTFIEPALCLFTQETNYRSSPSPFGIKMADRLTGRPIHLDISDLPMKRGIITNRNKFILGPSGSGKSFFTNHMVRQYYEQGAHVLLVDTGNSYQGLCGLINSRTRGEDGVYFTYTEDNPIAFNPFYTDDKVFDIEKRESIKTLIMTLWKRDDEPPTRSEEVALSNAVNGYIELIRDNGLAPSFNGFYEYVKGDYHEILKEKQVREKDFDIANFLNVLEPYYRGGEYDYLLNSDRQLDLLAKRFIVFEIDAIKDHKILFPIVTIIIMEVFINKMRRLKGVRKLILIEEAWKAIAKEGMAEYIKYLFKTVRKFFGEAIVVTQEVDDIIKSPIVKESIINNSDCKILLDQRKYMNKFDDIQAMLGLTDKEKAQVLSINMNNSPSRLYKEVWIGLGGTQSAVYATEVSLEEYLAYTTEETEKMEVMQAAAELDGNVELAIRHIAKLRWERENENNQ
ncbi:TraG family conjugative transposon ATPase [Flavobacterium johnsoniae]|uniref:Bacteroides conjugative transposon TraG-like protein n=1 Tax=Flavobacterium johnsoniae (strain ATCC 17061 / DSM 2064 / JCM 8514 / BCRC 14874 / CCUG 350202 / NBRC 14942 / NCIMB 11054 / UW101) TaxID=376686 RepID=A5FFJ6_FLAJ1|nr:TraG family conjugative transposon ATPase [Flavobacterium johnsoniae]ABQ06025.1 Bacteroides conjugative transposon TraG-like protein [Flavobacterium johnsoniae UW101]OXG00607.1 conjugal transfer protein TraG [Flavobacterium johnsoniae UW101]WQG81763.1 TraG family conjugative transposon ATPase [Flavobacterium johnsoniae UW101]SHK63568.1 Bacteroides conjugation system ATPase, TraG family [Flavobacterium johnsoniae]